MKPREQRTAPGRGRVTIRVSRAGRVATQVLLRGALGDALTPDLLMFESAPTPVRPVDPEATELDLRNPAATEVIELEAGPEPEATLLDIDPEGATQLPDGAPSTDSARFGRYLVASALGGDEEADLVLAYDLADSESPKPCILRRMLRRDLEDWTIRRTRFLSEATFTGQVRHPNLVRVFDAHIAGGVPFLAREVVDGMNARGLLAMSEGPIAVRTAVRIARDVAAALAAGAETPGLNRRPLGLVHGAMSPTAILLSAAGETKLTELSLPELAGRPLGPHNGGRIGPPAYRAPELDAGGPITQRSDLFSLGMVLAELLTGERPERAHGVPDPKRLRSRLRQRGDIPGPLIELVLQMLLEDPSRRPARASDLARLLGHVLERLGPGEPMATDVAPAFERARRRLIRERNVPVPTDAPPPRPAPEPAPELHLPWLTMGLVMFLVALLSCLVVLLLRG